MTKPPNTKIRRIFDSVARRFDTISNTYSVHRRSQAIAYFAQGKCLEAGAGTGKTAEVLKKQGFAVTATDISPQMVEIIKSRLHISAQVCDAEKLPFGQKTFDTVIASELIYYLDHPERFIEEAYRVLKSNGLLILTSANFIARLYNFVRVILRNAGFRKMYFDDPVDTFFSDKQIARLLRRHKFILVFRKRMIIIPFAMFDWLNKLLEHTPISFLGMFTVYVAKKS
jgi:ubiquinone/menaquinone biosynthesis C-methylase UbiE